MQIEIKIDLGSSTLLWFLLEYTFDSFGALRTEYSLHIALVILIKRNKQCIWYEMYEGNIGRFYHLRFNPWVASNYLYPCIADNAK